MNKVIIFVLLVGFTGSAVLAQQTAPASMPSVSDLVKSISGGATSSGEGTSVDAIMESISQQLTTTPATDDAPVQPPSVEQLLVTEETAPSVNQAIEAVDSKTGRYPPRLKIDFTEFPLRPSLGNPDDAVSKYLEAVIADRIRKRLSIPDVRFDFHQRTVKLAGNVKTERQRELVEFMIRLEPGIDTVKNEIKVK